MSTIGPELRNKDVPIACARKRTTAKVNGALEISRDDHVSRGIDGDSVSILIHPIAEALAPEVSTIGPELRNKDVLNRLRS